MIKMRISAAIGALALFVAGCDGIGGGSKLESIRIAQDLTKAAGEETSVKAYTCLAAPLILVGTFSKGDQGDFSFRARWTSDDETVVKVANRGDPVPGRDGEVFLRGGVLLPQDTDVERTTTVHAEYLGMRASMPVIVRPTENLRIVPSLARMVPKSAQKFTMRAKIEGVDTEVTTAGELFFVEDGAEEIATVGEEAQLQLVRGVAVGGPLTLKARFDSGCGAAPTAQVIIEDIPDNGLVLDYEEGFTDKIAERTSELLQLKVVFGDFNDDGDTDDEGEFMRLDTFDSQAGTLYGYDRDDDGQCELLLEDNGTTENPNPPTALTFGSLLTQLNTMTAVADDDTTDRSTVICASFGAASDPDGDGPETVTNGVVSNVLPLTIVDAKLSSLTTAVSDPCTPEAVEATGCEPLDPAPDPTTPVVDEGTILRIRANGLFDGGYEQDITKNVIFTSDQPRLAAVVGGGLLATATDITAVDNAACPKTSTSCQAKITATWSGAVAADNRTAELTITVNAVPDEEEPEE